MKSGRRKETKAEKEARHLFYEAVLAEQIIYKFGCWFSTVVPHVCDGPIDPCHIIDKQTLWPLARTLDKPEVMIYDVRNGVPGCRLIHTRFDRKLIRVYQDDLPERIGMFITDWEAALEQPGVLQEKLNRKCPEGARP